MAARIDQMIDDIYEFVEGCKGSAFSPNKIIVPREELIEKLDELRARTPDEIKRYQKIISNKDAIIKDAEGKASVIVQEATEKAKRLVDENEIMQQVYAQANALIESTNSEVKRMYDDAKNEAKLVREGALEYAKEKLESIEKLFGTAYDSIKLKNDGMLEALKGMLDVVNENKNFLINQAVDMNNESAEQETKPVEESLEFEEFEEEDIN